MTDEALDVAIIGAGTAGISARAEVAKVTENYRVFDPGPYGTTCARSACMPSKALLQSAHDHHRRHTFDALGLTGARHLDVDPARVLESTRELRNGLVAGVLEDMNAWRETHLVPHAPVFEPDGSLRAGGQRFDPRSTVIATGSRPVVPPDWRERLGARLLTSEDIFELEDLPGRVAVVGLGAVGLELGQALARLGVAVTGFDPVPSIGGVTDPALLSRLREALSAEMTLVEAEAEPVIGDGNTVRMQWEGGAVEVDAVLVAMGRTPNLSGLGLEDLGLSLEDGRAAGLPEGQLNWPGRKFYLAGDAGPGPALLHEAADEGRIAGYFAARDEEAVFRRRVPLRIVFCSPQIALAGASWTELEPDRDQVAVGGASFDKTGRIQLQRESGGALRIYADRATGRLLGAAILAPEAEHLAHLLAHAVEARNDLEALLRMPAYHPTHEEVLRRALRATLANSDVEMDDLEEIRCADALVDCDDAAPN